MKNKIALAVYLNRQNKNSFAAIVGALETDKYFNDLPVYFWRDENEMKKGAEELSAEYSKIIIAFSFATFQAKEIFYSVKNLKSEIPANAIFLAGGPHPSGDPRGVLEKGFDFAIIGEGERAVGELLKALESGKGDYGGAGNLAYLDKGKLVFTFKAEPIDLDDYPPFAPKHKIFGPIEITRGCPWGCKYCQTSYLFGRRIRHRSLDKICRYAEILKKNDRLDLRFITPNALSYGSRDGKEVNLAAIENLLKAARKTIGDNGRIFFGSFPSEVRPEQVSEEALVLIKKYCDNDNLIIGAQSGSQKMLDYLGRGHQVGDIYRAAELIIQNGFKVNVDFIFGLPGETKKDIEATFKAMEDLAAMGARIHGHTFMPLPGTPLAKAEAGALSASNKKRLKILEAKGRLYGEWEKQEKIG